MTTERRDFTEEEINYAWSRAKVVEDVDQSKWRQDYAGAWICRDAYGDMKSEYGWEIDHQKPLALDGTYDLDNLFPLQWNNNRTKGDDYPIWKTSISSFFNDNINEEKYWKAKDKEYD